MNQGTLVRIPEGKHFGFISIGDKEYFFHRDDYFSNWHELCRDHSAGIEVQLQCRIVESNKGLRVAEVNRIMS